MNYPFPSFDWIIYRANLHIGICDEQRYCRGYGSVIIINMVAS